ncbi:MAG: methyltransferase domain-containing protein [Pseudomonadota bacterium]
MSKPAIPQVFNTARHIARKNRAASAYGEYDFLKARVSRDLIERLGDTSHSFTHALDLGAHTGQLTKLLEDSDQVGATTAFETSPAMAETAGKSTLSGDPETLPFEENRFDLVTSALALHWINDLPGQLIQINRLLKPDGLFLGALFGAGTLMELRTCLMEAETEITGGAGLRVSPLPGLQDCAGLLQRAGFALPVADVDHITVRYDHPMRLMADLKGMGESAAFASVSSPLRRDVLMRMAELYLQRFSDPDGRIRASFEVVWLSGWAPAPGQPRPKRPGSARASLAEALGSVERKAGEKAGPSGNNS